MTNPILSEISEFVAKHPFWLISTLMTIIITNPAEIIVAAILIEKFIVSLRTTPELRYLWGVMGMYLFANCIYTIQELIDAYYIPKLECQIRMNLLAKIASKQEINYETMDGGEIITHIKNIPFNAGSFIERFVVTILNPMLCGIIISGYMMRINASVGLSFVATTILYFACTIMMYWSIPKGALIQEHAEGILINQIDDSLNNAMSVIMCDSAKPELAHIHECHARHDSLFTKNIQKRAYGFIVSGISSVVLLATMVWIIFKAYWKKELSKSDMIIMTILTIGFVRFIRQATGRVMNAFLHYAKIIKGNQFIDALSHKTVPDGHETGIPIHGNITFQNVSYKYDGNDELSLNRVSFKIREKDRVAIVGGSGSGKTTILKLIMGFGHPSEGRVTIDGHDVRSIRRKHLRKHISVVPQNVKLFNRSIMDNICYGSKGLDPERVREELRELHVMRTFNTLPDGLDSVVGKNGDKLSGGQKQIVYLLRCYFRRTPIVLMDEPTSALDMGNAKYVRRMIDAMSRHSTLIVVTHDPSFANTFPVKMRMQNGRLMHSDSYSVDYMESIN